jgi:hypothetical protein
MAKETLLGNFARAFIEATIGAKALRRTGLRRQLHSEREQVSIEGLVEPARSCGGLFWSRKAVLQTVSSGANL